MNIQISIAIIVVVTIGYFFNNFEIVKKSKKKQKSCELEQQREKYQKTKKAFSELMEYDYDSALGGGNKE